MVGCGELTRLAHEVRGLKRLDTSRMGHVFELQSMIFGIGARPVALSGVEVEA